MAYTDTEFVKLLEGSLDELTLFATGESWSFRGFNEADATWQCPPEYSPYTMFAGIFDGYRDKGIASTRFYSDWFARMMEGTDFLADYSERDITMDDGESLEAVSSQGLLTVCFLQFVKDQDERAFTGILEEFFNIIDGTEGGNFTRITDSEYVFDTIITKCLQHTKVGLSTLMEWVMAYEHCFHYDVIAVDVQKGLTLFPAGVVNNVLRKWLPITYREGNEPRSSHIAWLQNFDAAFRDEDAEPEWPAPAETVDVEALYAYAASVIVRSADPAPLIAEVAIALKVQFDVTDTSRLDEMTAWLEKCRDRMSIVHRELGDVAHHVCKVLGVKSIVVP